MLFALYKSGRSLRKRNTIVCIPGIVAIIIYTLNEGLRFGRAVDFNLYFGTYNDIVAGKDDKSDFLFMYLCKFWGYIGLTFQSFILFLSFMFIVGTLLFMKNFKNILPLALPLFVFFSIKDVENMIRWYLSFSFVLIGLSELLEKEKLTRKYILTNVIACLIHYAMLPVPIILYCIAKLKKPMLPPCVSFPLFLGVYIFFETDVMLQFTDMANLLIEISGERFSSYGDKAEYWLTGGFAGEDISGSIGYSEFAFFFLLVYWGYRAVKQWQGWEYVFTYNCFLVGLFLLPIGRKIELLMRYDNVFFIFHAIVMAHIIYFLYIKKEIRVKPIILCVCFFILFYLPVKTFMSPLEDDPRKYLYVWNKSNLTPEKMYQIWIDDMHKEAKKQ
jgi:hypothetical protein